MVTVGRRSGKRMLGVWMNGELVGHWSFSPTSGHAFSYAPSWREHPNARSISLSMPLSHGEASFKGELVESYFDNLLPDSPSIRKRIASKFGVNSTHAFQLLEKIGRDCVGAIQLLPADSDPPNIRQINAEPLSDLAIERLLDATLANPTVGMPEAEEELRISIAGAQEKTALLWHEEQWCRPLGSTPTTHILKLPMGDVGGMRADFSASVENEWLCAQIVRAYGLPVAASEVANFGRHKALVVTRFDRKLIDDWWARLPQEDFCQVKGLWSVQKYEEHGGPGISTILDILRGSDEAQVDRENFLTAKLVFWLLAAPDGHAKNFSIFLGPRDRFWATPLYDIMSAWPVIGKAARQFQWQKVRLAMALRTSNAHYRMQEIQRRHWNAVAKANALGADFEGVIERIASMTLGVIDSVASKLPTGFPTRVSGPIFDGLLAQTKRLTGTQ